MTVALLSAATPVAGLHTSGSTTRALVELDLRSRNDIEIARELPLDIWSDRLAPGSVLARVRAEDRALLDSSGLGYSVVSLDVDDDVARTRLQLDQRPSASHGDGSYFENYRDLEEINAELDALVAEHGDLAVVSTYGESLEGRELRALEITRARNSDAPVVVLNAAQHAREWVSVTSAMYVANALVHRADEPEFDSLLTQVVFVIVPVVNPDGYVFSWEEDRFWRKNRRDGIGVDTNRNFSVAFGGPGSSGNPETNNYRGEAAFSEPETAALRDLLVGYPNLVVHLDVHAFGQLVLYPWGFVDEPSPAADAFTMLGADIASAMSNPFGTEYVPIPGAQLYPAAGNAIDWSYGELGAYAITLELRPGPEGRHPEAFDLPADQISDVGEEVVASVLTLAEFAAGSPATRPGDDGSASTTGDDGSSSGTPSDESSGGEAGTAGPDTAPEDDGDGAASATSPTATSNDSTSSTSRGVSSEVPTGSETSTDPAGAVDDDGGCNCSSDPANRGGWWAGAWLLVLGLVRRRSHGRAVLARRGDRPTG